MRIAVAGRCNGDSRATNGSRCRQPRSIDRNNLRSRRLPHHRGRNVPAVGRMDIVTDRFELQIYARACDGYGIGNDGDRHQFPLEAATWQQQQSQYGPDCDYEA